ncbi:MULTISPECIES: hypothetical protein [Stenotrophomonas]|uniref:hypothetical protein n=1 Tax=Stenotrophomonas TaxID=40323 RepID=UPI000B054C21|nr:MULTISPECIES: hypothetical protein [Stenotrophomonas]TDV30473.1 hypothetical protein N440_1302 [Stenotrophomonas sp. CC22-02]
MINLQLSRIITLTLLLLPGVAIGDGSKIPAPTYSNVCRHPESGDLLGLELSFIGGADRGYVLVQRYEGEVSTPEVMKIEVRGDQLILLNGKTESIALLREKSGMRATYLDGALSPAGSANEKLAPSQAVWQGRQVGVCK